MDPRKIAWLTLQLVVVVVVVALIVGQILGQPILLSYVTTGSMEPTLEPGDGFVAIPPELAGSVGTGDVVVFDAQEIEGGGLTTHRIVGEDERGFVTQGDANPFTDQDSGEPPIQEAEIVAVAWQPGGEVVAIPHLGTAVEGVQSGLESVQWLLAQLFGTRAFLGLQGIAYMLLAASVFLYMVDIWLADDTQRERTTSRNTGTSSRLLVFGLTLLVVGGATAAMVMPAGTHEFGIVSAEFESESPDVIEQGTSESFRYEVVNSGIVPTTVYLEPASDNIDAEPSKVDLPGRSTENTTVTITAPPETGHYHSYLQEHRYLDILPGPIIESLHETHPWLPILAINATIGVPFYLVGMLLLGTGRVRSRTRDGPSRLGRLRTRYF